MLKKGIMEFYTVFHGSVVGKNSAHDGKLLAFFARHAMIWTDVIINQDSGLKK